MEERKQGIIVGRLEEERLNDWRESQRGTFLNSEQSVQLHVIACEGQQ